MKLEIKITDISANYSALPEALRPSADYRYKGYLVTADGNEESLASGATEAEAMSKSIAALAEIAERIDIASYLEQIDGQDHATSAESRAESRA